MENKRVGLNIVDKAIDGSEWKAQDKGLTAEDLDKVVEQKTDNAGALNSLPTPFARFFVAREAFRRVWEEHLKPQTEAGYAYRQIVSNILDVYELLFNLKYHKNSWTEGQKIELREWKSDENLKYLREKMPVLYNSFASYYKTDINQSVLYFLVYTEAGKDYLLACSSPMTGFVTPPDMDHVTIKKNGTSSHTFVEEQYNELSIRRKSGGQYFKDVKLFDERDEDFKNYMFNELFGSDNVDDRFKSIKEYIRSFAKDNAIRVDYEMKLRPVKTDQNEDLVINGLPIMYSDEVDVENFFTRSIIRLPYRISENGFKSVVYDEAKADRDYDYLLPFKPEVASLFEGSEIDAILHEGRHKVTVTLNYKGKQYEKVYTFEQGVGGASAGKIVNLSEARCNFDLGLFPNILSCKKEENNYFKVLVVAADEDKEAPNFTIDKISLSFYKKNEKKYVQIHEMDPHLTGAEYGVLPAVVRSRQSRETEGGTKFYELFNTSFDMVEVSVMGNTGLLFPIWEKSQQTNDAYTYAIDLGTSNTFMSRLKIGDNNKPELFKMERPMVSYLHAATDEDQISLSRRIEDGIFESAKNKIKTEFLPALIDGKDYKFPIRTALCGIHNRKDAPRLFDNHNIAFFYERLMANDDQDVFTDIKWDKNDAMLRVFIRELLLIVKCDILQRNGNLGDTRLIWFRPLSFMGNVRNLYQEIWTSEPNDVLGIPSTQISCFSESEAPYYYFKKMDYIKDSDAVSVIDIGGGSTDFVYFQDNKPQVANSVHFGCDVLWENGFIEYSNVKENGIFKKYAGHLQFKNRQDLKDLNDSFEKDDSVKTKDVINFWLSNASACGIKKSLQQDFKPVFVYHLTSILYYMSCMYKDNGLAAPKTVVFSGNGSRYIDDYISMDTKVIKAIIDLIFNRVFGGNHDVSVKLPPERKESTCYGGLYRDMNAMDVPEKVYQGVGADNLETVGEINKHFDELKSALVEKYSGLSSLYKEVLDALKKQGIVDNTENTTKYVNATEEDMSTPLNTYYKTQVKEKYAEEVILYDSVFFLPIINKIFDLTKL